MSEKPCIECWRHEELPEKVHKCRSVDLVTGETELLNCSLRRNSRNDLCGIEGRLYRKRAPLDCFITVPEVTLDTGLVVPSFRIGKYTCSEGSDGDAVIDPDLAPWVNITHGNARAACEEAGWKLMSETQRLAIATDITRQDKNWTGGKVGEGLLFQGLRKHEWGYGAKSGNFAPEDPDERRWHVLSNGEHIFDFAGNVWQWIFDDVQGDEEGVIRAMSNDSITFKAAPFHSLEKGAGWRHEKSPNWLEMWPISGGSWTDGSDAGVWALDLSYARAASYYTVGFRAASPL